MTYFSVMRPYSRTALHVARITASRAAITATLALKRVCYAGHIIEGHG